ncbi:MAG: SulP family inorganic anion transporter, partial [Deltaproteobacteria bacterium]|nr:SulP family inorganic anion transporter [Deltaproteobacteria bacterium]
ARLTRWLTRPVLTGFTAAAAVMIAASQLAPLMGVHVPRSPELLPLLRSLALASPRLDLTTLGLGLAGVALLVALKRRWPRFPRALLLVALSSVVVFAFGLSSSGVAVVGEIPAGLPTPSLPALSLTDALALAPSAAILWLVGFSEATSIGAHFARKHDYALTPRRELIALGMANLAAGVFQGYPVTGGFARSAVHDAAGARTTRAGLVTAALVALTLAWLTPLLRDLPMTALAAIILTAVAGLVDVAEIRRLRAHDHAGLGLTLLTFAATLGLGIVWGLLLGAGVGALMSLVRRSARKAPRTSHRGDCSVSRP